MALSDTSLSPPPTGIPEFVTLTTDFGFGSSYVAAMKGVLYSLAPDLRIVDLTHAIPPQDVRAGALFLETATRWFPTGTLHVAVVDPGVGGARRVIYAEIGDQRYLAPDNGLLSGLARHRPIRTIRHVSNPDLWQQDVSATFHGRDIFAPVAARLAMGLDIERLGPALLGENMGGGAKLDSRHQEPSGQEPIVYLQWPEVVVAVGKISGVVESIDSFGNLITNIREEQLAAVPRGESTTITCDEHATQGIFRTYSDQPAMTFIALVGSDGKLELAIVDDSAALMLGVRVGTPVTISW